jgi:multiple sugar transport system substrate-binding protein
MTFSFLKKPVLIITACCLIGCQKKPFPASSARGNAPQASTITILWVEWKPASSLQTLVKDFTKQTGIRVIVKMVPFDIWQQTAFEELDKHGTAYDLVVGDSQWLGRGSVNGHYTELTDWVKGRGIQNTMTSASMEGYAEYPKGSKRYWAIPLEGDAMGWAYRKDKFEDPHEREAFQKKYGYPLDVPKTWEQLRDISEFFYRPKDDFYGVGIITDRDYDGITMGFENLLFAWGGEWGTEDYRVKNFLNSSEGTDALKFFKSLYQFSPPHLENAFCDDINDAFTSGKIAMGMNYFAFFPELTDPAKNPHVKEIGFFSMPAGPTGIRASALGGMGISVVSYGKKKAEVFRFLEWFAREDTQEKWSELGGYTCNKKVLASQKFLNATPYNRAFMESMGMVKDFWVTPEYSDLLAASQKYLRACVVENKYTPEESLRLMANEMENVFEYSGYYKE